MARYSVAGAKASGAAAAWLLELRSGTSRDLRVWEVGVFTETAVAGTVALVRSASAGTGSATNVVPQADDSPGSSAALSNMVTAYATTAPTMAGVDLRRGGMPATIGSGIVWTFPEGIVVPSSTFSTTTNALCIRQISTAAVTYGVYFVFDE